MRRRARADAGETAPRLVHAPSLVSPAENVGRSGSSRPIGHAHGGAHGAELRRPLIGVVADHQRRRRCGQRSAAGAHGEDGEQRRLAVARDDRPPVGDGEARRGGRRRGARDVGVAGREHPARCQRRRRRGAIALDAAALFEVAAGLVCARRPRAGARRQIRRRAGDEVEAPRPRRAGRAGRRRRPRSATRRRSTRSSAAPGRRLPPAPRRRDRAPPGSATPAAAARRRCRSRDRAGAPAARRTAPRRTRRSRDRRATSDGRARAAATASRRSDGRDPRRARPRLRPIGGRRRRRTRRAPVRWSARRRHETAHLLHGRDSLTRRAAEKWHPRDKAEWSRFAATGSVLRARHPTSHVVKEAPRAQGLYLLILLGMQH